MIKAFPINILRLILLIIFQLLIFDNIELGGYLNPFIYILFIILLPFETPGWLLLISGFMLGLTIDIFSETLGMHTTATVFAAFMRPMALAMFAPREGYGTGTKPTLSFYGLRWFLQYSLLVIFAHHTVLFLAELFSVQYLFFVLLRIILSTLFTGLIIGLSQYFVFRD